MKKLIFFIFLISAITGTTLWLVSWKYQNELETNNEEEISVKIKKSQSLKPVLKRIVQKEIRLKDMSEKDKAEALSQLKDLYPTHSETERAPSNTDIEDTENYNDSNEDDFRNIEDNTNESYYPSSETELNQ